MSTATQHGSSSERFEQPLLMGGFSMPSLATKTALTLDTADSALLLCVSAYSAEHV